MALFDALSGELQKWVTGIKVETAWLPPIEIRDPFKPSPGPAAPNPVLSILKPRVTFELQGGALPPAKVAPYGEPGPNRWPVLRNGLLLAGLALLVGAAVARRRRLSRRRG